MVSNRIAAPVFSAAVLLAASSLSGVQSSPYIITDSRVRNLDVTPTLGRGYSIMTNSFQSICLMVDETTVPSYNYDYSFYDFSKTSNLEVETSKKMSYSFGYWWLKGNIRKDSKRTTNVEKKIRYITSSMRIERYYASVREEISPIVDDAVMLLNNRDYVGFFKACGPNYVRGVRRAQEVTAFFVFESTSDDRSSQVSTSVQVSSWWWRRRSYSGSTAANVKNKKETESMKIIIQGYGLGLSQDGSESFVAQNLQDYQRIMDFAFHTMVRIPESLHIGMVYGMELAPWVENTSFQVEANIFDESIEVPLPHSMIPRAFLITDPTYLTFNKARNLYKCKEPSFTMDRYGYCCEAGSLYDPVDKEYDEDIDPAAAVCKPVRTLPPSFIKDNMVANGEFVARMDRAVRYKLNQLSTLERCISAARAIPERYDYNTLTPQDTVVFDGKVDFGITVFELKMAVDPFNDYSMLKHMTKELDEFLEMFVVPCYGALFGINQASNPDASYFMSYPWHNHDQCNKLSCFGNAMRWDRSSKEGGCVPSLIAGADAPAFDGDNCKKDIGTGTLQCKNSNEELQEFHQKAVKIWKHVVPAGQVSYFMDHYCMPKVQNKKAPVEAIDALKEAYARALEQANPKVKSNNVALGKQTDQISVYPHMGSTAMPSLAVDGNTNGDFWKGSVMSTRYEYDPWWWVYLGREHTIQRIVVYNNSRGETRLRGLLVEILLLEKVVWSTSSNKYNYEQIFPVEDIVGDKVRISIPGRTEYLHVAEVEVWNKFY